MRLGVAVIVTIACLLPGLARSQSGAAGADVAPAIPLHPDVMTVLQLPEDVVHAQILHRREFWFGFFASRLYVQPHPGTPAGVEALIDVETRTRRQMFRVRVVARAEDAAPEFVVPAAAAVERTAEARPEALPVMPAAPEPAANAPSQPQPSHAGQASAAERAEPVPEPAAAMDSSQRYDLAVHAVVSLGFTALDIAGYESTTARQPHRAFGLRLTGAPDDAWWAVEAGVSAEWAAGAMQYREQLNEEELEVNGPWLRAEIGMRARFGVKWIPTAYLGIGMQTHLRRSEKITRSGLQPTETMKDGAVLALGVGLHRRVRDVLLGLDFQIRRGGPDDYRSVAALWTVGYYLDQGE